MAVESLIGSFKLSEKKVFIRIKNRVCETPEELLSSDLCFHVVRRAVLELKERNSILTKVFNSHGINDDAIRLLLKSLTAFAKMPYAPSKSVNSSAEFLRDKHLLNDLVEYLYNYWRSFDRFVICDAEGEDYDLHPFRTFNQTIEYLTHLVRRTYRDIQENISQSHPRIYRQVTAGAEIATITTPKQIKYPSEIYRRLNSIPIVRQILLYPPLVLNPPMNKRRGKFERITKNPLETIPINRDEWVGYPAKVGSLLIMIYFHEKFFELGMSLCNLFELANDRDLERTPDAVYLFGAADGSYETTATMPTVFYDDTASGMLVGVVPDKDEFGYFGYLKKMVLTLHNIKKMKQGILPFHGALIKIFLKNGKSATILSMGDTGAGKSETLEAFRQLGHAFIQDLVIIADDMGSIELNTEGEALGFGTEIGAFLRLDDLQPGYALGQIDRAIIMSPNQVNARIVLPVTTYENLVKGHKINYVFYANNYEEIDEDHPIIERFKSSDDALKVFKEGTVMSKGTTTTTGLVHSYFANVFGPVQCRELHDGIARRFFEAFFKQNVFVGQMRTRLGISGWEHKGPEEAARELLKLISR